MNKICLHWTAGPNKPCDTDLKAYHFLIDDTGKKYTGKFKPEDNLNCNDGVYAQHCGGGNTGCIGISVCGMANFDLTKKQTRYPLTQIQIETMCKLCAELCIKYKIEIKPETVFTHFEFDQKQAKKQGKIDITYLPYLPNLQKEKVGDFLRNKIAWYVIQIKKGKENGTI